jgi:metallophosphoesterase superfamily enzyme
VGFSTPEERMAAVWELTQTCLLWNSQGAHAPRLKDSLSEFNAKGVEYLVVGAHALAAHGHVRATKDMGVWIRPTRGMSPGYPIWLGA